MKPERVASNAVGTAAGIAIGLLVLRAYFHPIESLVSELHANRLTYIYVFLATAGVSLWLGYVLGRRAEELRHLTMMDSLTGLHNRLGLQVRLRDECRRAERFRAPLALLLIDIDHLKRVNDERGHQAGDHILRAAGRAIRNTLRDTDFGARWGGDEFAIVAPNTASRAAHRLAGRLMIEMRKWARLDDMVVTASVGVATYDPANGAPPTVETLMAAADAALYRAKLHGRNRMSAA